MGGEEGGKKAEEKDRKSGQNGTSMGPNSNTAKSCRRHPVNAAPPARLEERDSTTGGGLSPGGMGRAERAAQTLAWMGLSIKGWRDPVHRSWARLQLINQSRRLAAAAAEPQSPGSEMRASVFNPCAAGAARRLQGPRLDTVLGGKAATVNPPPSSCEALPAWGLAG